MPVITSENFIFYIIIALPTFFILRWLFKKLIWTDRNITMTALAGTVILTPLLYLCAVSIFFSILFYEPEKNFNSSKWLTDTAHRYQMAKDIIESKILIGKNQHQVIQILGFATNEFPERNLWNYDMGEGGGGLGFMFHNLEVVFDKNKVIAVYHGKIQD